jgi:hypothetical protein
MFAIKNYIGYILVGVLLNPGKIILHLYDNFT